jgi:large subunit ribosomal protein L28
MSKVCDITGKKVMMGNNVSHSKRRTRRTFLPNLFKKRFFLAETGEWISLKVSASGLRTITKKGPDAAIKEARAKGFMK